VFSESAERHSSLLMKNSALPKLTNDATLADVLVAVEDGVEGNIY